MPGATDDANDGVDENENENDNEARARERREGNE